MSKTSSETRTLLLILGVVGLLSCGCLCVPLGLLALGIGLPAIAQVQKAADKVRRQQQELPDWVERPGDGIPPVAPLPPMPGPIEFRPPPNFALPPTPPPPTIPSPPAVVPSSPPRENPRTQPNEGGLAGLNESQRRTIYRSATSHRRSLERSEKMRTTLRASGQDTSAFDQHFERTRQLMEGQLDRLCQMHRIGRAELDQIIAEGDQQGWSGAGSTRRP
jgi:hypothetical protein